MKILVGVIMFLAFGGAAGGFAETDLKKVHSGIDQSKKELGGIKKKIQEEKQHIREIGKKESSVLAQLNSVDKNLVKKEKELKRLNQRLASVADKVKKTGQALESLNQSISSQERVVAHRLVTLYKYSDRVEAPQALFSSSPSFHEYLNHNRYLTDILRQDRELMDDYRKRQATLGEYRDRLQDGEKELRDLKKETEQKRADIQRDRSEKTRLLDSTRDSKRVHLAAIKELETAQGQLQGLINRLEKELRSRARQEILTSPGKGFGAHRGRLPMPVEGSLLSTFGRNENPKFNTFSVQKGIEIEAPEGAEIHAVHDGRVLYADWFKGYGKILIIDHGEGYYTLSGHASSLMKKVGEEVRTGEVVGLVGDTGSFKGSCLYFEIRQRGKPLDPLEWLARQKGR
jgi:murein hydrolase activator